MELPKPTEDHQKLHAMIGEWTGKETMHPTHWSPQGGTATSKTTARLDLDGFFIISDYEQYRDGAVTYRGHGVFGWDARRQRYTIHWYDGMGVGPDAPALGTWEGTRLCFEHQHHMGHTRYTYDFVRDGAYTFRLEQSQDGTEWSPFIDGTYERVAG